MLWTYLTYLVWFVASIPLMVAPNPLPRGDPKPLNIQKGAKQSTPIPPFLGDGMD